MKKKSLKKEVEFVNAIGVWLTGGIPEDQRAELEELFGLEHGRFVADCNRYLERTIKAIRKGYLSLEGFSFQDAECFSRLLGSDKLDGKLQSELSHLLYGADERARYLS